jgi:hypothetical protein
VNDPTWALCERVLHQALARNSLDDPGAALCALLWLLRNRHRAAVTAAARRAYRDGFEWPDPHSHTLAESIKDLALVAAIHGHDVEEGCADNDRAVACSGEAGASGMKVIADVLEELILGWDLEAMVEVPAAAC